MEIECYLSQGCASEDALRKNIAAALLNEGMEAEVNFHRIDNSQAVSLGISGSPSIFIDGKELQPTGNIGLS
ncbi:MAG: thioredoxin family protein [Nitrospirota bacterium]